MNNDDLARILGRKGYGLAASVGKAGDKGAALMDSGQLKPSKWSEVFNAPSPAVRIALSGEEECPLTQEQMGNTLKGAIFGLSPHPLRVEYAGPYCPAFTLPYPPTLNHLFFTVGNRRVLSKEGRAYKQTAASLALTLGLKVLTGPVAITIEVYRPRKAGDLDNTFKIILDSLKGLTWEDDKQVVSIVARRFDDKENPRVRVRVEPAASLEPQLG